MMKNKRGWIKMVEAFAAILIIAGIVLIVINQQQGESGDLSARVQDSEAAILRDIQLNNSLREDVLATSGTVEWDSPGFPIDVKNRIIAKTPNYLECTAKICATGDLCLSASQEKSVYAESAIITATSNSYNPRQLKLFCSMK